MCIDIQCTPKFYSQCLSFPMVYIQSAIASSPTALDSIATRWVRSVHTRTIISGRLRTNFKERPATRSPSRMCLLEATHMQTRCKVLQSTVPTPPWSGPSSTEVLASSPSNLRIVSMSGSSPALAAAFKSSSRLGERIRGGSLWQSDSTHERAPV
ncbi:hypothetical protein HD554DRAFT_1774938 [Boletus coccyginus]|nr:hypothetical protein HD554DRAFT_1774938 [Boletus coccyginus]